jgi:threonine aldolase
VIFDSRISFASDNHAGVHPRVLEAIAEANRGFAPAYGADPWTERLREVFRAEFGASATVYPVFNGTGANVIALSSALRSYEAVICAAKSHIDVDEAGAPERVGGFKLLTIATPDQKLTVDLIREKLARRGDVHAVQPRVVSLTQSTELGTVYTLAELRAISEFARANELYLHIDGSRIANAAVSLDCSLRECTTEIGADLLSFGGTKNGLLGAEAVVCLNPKLEPPLAHFQKQFMQLASKTRFFSAQLLALFEEELWKKNAEHANKMASQLAHDVAKIPGVALTQRTQANAVFAALPARSFAETVREIQKRFPFYVWDELKHEARWMTSFATRPSDVSDFAAEIARVLHAR